MGRRGLLPVATLLVLMIGSATPAAAAGPAYDPSGLEQQLYSLINQDRYAAGLGGLAANPTLFGLARGARQQACGGGMTFNGRAEDMYEREYFSHYIPPCGALIADVVRAYGVPWTAFGENIAWNQASPGSAAAMANSAFMNSPEHRANNLGDYNSVGVGAWPVAGPWGPAGGASGVVIYAVIFAKVSGVSGPVSRPPVAAAPVTRVPAAGLAPDPAPAPPAAPPTAPPQVLALSVLPPPVMINRGPNYPYTGPEGAAAGPAFLANFVVLGLSVLCPLAPLTFRRRRRRIPPSRLRLNNQWSLRYLRGPGPRR